MFAIEAKGLTKRFSDVTAVNAIDLKIGDRGVYSLLGVNGAGKTTTVKMLSGLMLPTSGEIRIFGMKYDKNEREIKKAIGVSPQETAVAPNLTVKENLAFIAGMYGLNKNHAAERVEEVMQKLQLKSFEKKKAGKLSGGYKRRLSIGMAIVHEPKLLFLDEPTLGLDVLARREIWRTIEEIKRTAAVVLTTHYMEEAEALSDNVWIMRGGEIVSSGSPEELKNATNAQTLEEAFIALSEKKI